MANEVLLLHGTTEAKAQHIMRQGFDDRMCSRGLYGRGVYFTCDSCKALQHCGNSNTRCVILARVILGHPYWAEGPMRTHERPPQVDPEGVPHDSTIVQPGIPNGNTKGAGKGKASGKQTHWEFVVSRGDLQAYPEL